jgi:flagellar protein FliO/FliZ
MSNYWTFVALLIVLALIFGVAWVARKFGVGGRLAARGGKRRLSIVEVLPLDGKRRLVLLRRDDVEHLVLIGTHDDVVVETAIRPAPEPTGSFAAALGTSAS